MYTYIIQNVYMFTQYRNRHGIDSGVFPKENALVHYTVDYTI